MHLDRPSSPPRLSQHQWFVLRTVAFAALLLGCRAAWLYHAAGLTLSHYDAKAHLVVARRVVDNLTPGWQQLGAIWLPLPHLLNLVPVQIDAFYRTGASAVAISVLAYAVGVYGIARLVARASGSLAAAVAGASVFALNPDVLYLQSTPMTEALLLALIVMGASLTIDWLDIVSATNRIDAGRVSPAEAGSDTPSRGARAPGARAAELRAGCTIAAACLTRYEAWPVTAALLAVSVAVLRLRGMKASAAVRRALDLARYPGAVVGLFLVQSRLTVGKGFVTGGFFVPDNLDTGNPFRAIGSVWWGLHVVSGYGVELVGVAAAIACVVVALRDRRRSTLLAALAPIAVGALPVYAFFEGHPFRIRYMTPLVPALGVCAGLGVGFLRRWPRQAAAVAVVALVLIETRPFDFQAPMLLEAQWDSGNSAARREVTRYLAAHYDGRTILASMGSLAHYMQELSRAGFDLKTFLHEGNGALWSAALEQPRWHVGWILVEEWAEGGDTLAKLAQEDRHFLDGFERVAEGGGVALYRAGGAGGAGGAGRGAKAGGAGAADLPQPPYPPYLP